MQRPSTRSSVFSQVLNGGGFIGFLCSRLGSSMPGAEMLWHGDARRVALGKQMQLLGLLAVATQSAAWCRIGASVRDAGATGQFYRAMRCAQPAAFRKIDSLGKVGGMRGYFTTAASRRR
jgi:hypothetical protein